MLYSYRVEDLYTSEFPPYVYPDDSPKATDEGHLSREDAVMSKIVYVESPEGMEPPQCVWVREENQAPPEPEDPADYFVDTHHPHYCLQTEADVRAWMAYMFHPTIIEGMKQIRFV
jgi:hypothetical protein